MRRNWMMCIWSSRMRSLRRRRWRRAFRRLLRLSRPRSRRVLSSRKLRRQRLTISRRRRRSKMRYFIILLFCATALAEPQLLSVKKISDTAPHNAFTDLAFFKDRWFCTFREGQAHVSPDGAICILESADGEKWERGARLTRADGDLRDPKISITPDNRLLLTAAIALPKAGGKKEHRTLVWFSEDGRRWSEGKEVGDVDVWLWRIAWNGGRAYGVGYATAGADLVRLYESADGNVFKALVPTLFDKGQPSEAALAFDNDTCYCLLRRDAKGKDGS